MRIFFCVVKNVVVSRFCEVFFFYSHIARWPIPNRCVTSWNLAVFSTQSLFFCFRVNHPRFFRTKQISIMNFQIFRHFSVQNLFPNVSSVSIYFQNSSPPKKTVLPNDLQKPTCYTKVPKLAPLVDVQRIPKFGYLSQTTGCDMTHPGETLR